MAGSELLILGTVAYDSIETPLARQEYILGGSASYAALAASYFCNAKIVSVVGNDFKKSDIDRLKNRNVNLDDLTVEENQATFFWSGKYHENFNTRDTLDTQLNCLEAYNPKLSQQAKKCEYVLLANATPQLQMSMLEQIENPKFVILDTMDLWINIANEALHKLINKVDLLILNDSEAKHLTGENNLIVAGELLCKEVETVIIKLGEFGAMLFHKDGFFTLPAYPIRALFDPTGAGDSFAGALAATICKADNADFETIKLGMLAGSATASITVESFSCEKLEQTGLAEIENRQEYIKKISKI